MTVGPLVLAIGLVMLTGIEQVVEGLVSFLGSWRFDSSKAH